MKKSLALLSAVATLALPKQAKVRRASLTPTGTVLSSMAAA